MIPTSIDGTDITGATIDGNDVQEITVDGQTVFTAVPAGAFDITQFSFDTSLSVGLEAGASEFSDDGSRLFVSGEDEIQQYNVGSAYEISTASFDTSISTNNNEAAARGLAFSDDGFLMHVGIESPNEIQQFTLSTPFDITSASFDTVNVPPVPPRGLTWNDDGSQIYIFGNTMFQATAPTPYDVTNVSWGSGIQGANAEVHGLAWNNDGTRFYQISDAPDTIFQFSAATPFDINNLSLQATINAQDSRSRGISWNDDGSRFYEAGYDGQKIYQYTL